MKRALTNTLVLRVLAESTFTDCNGLKKCWKRLKKNNNSGAILCIPSLVQSPDNGHLLSVTQNNSWTSSLFHFWFQRLFSHFMTLARSIKCCLLIYSLWLTKSDGLQVWCHISHKHQHITFIYVCTYNSEIMIILGFSLWQWGGGRNRCGCFCLFSSKIASFSTEPPYCCFNHSQGEVCESGWISYH